MRLYTAIIATGTLLHPSVALAAVASSTSTAEGGAAAPKEDEGHRDLKGWKPSTKSQQPGSAPSLKASLKAPKGSVVVPKASGAAKAMKSSAKPTGTQAPTPQPTTTPPCLLFADDFDPIVSDQWQLLQLVNGSSGVCNSESGSSALVFNLEPSEVCTPPPKRPGIRRKLESRFLEPTCPPRIAQSKNLTFGANNVLSFFIKKGYDDGPDGECSVPGACDDADLFLEFEDCNGSWQEVWVACGGSYYGAPDPSRDNEYRNFTMIEIAVPVNSTGCQRPTSFRFKQNRYDFGGNLNNWAIDDIKIKCNVTDPPVNPPVQPCSFEYYRRILSDFNVGDGERHLFALMEGEELEMHSAAYEMKKHQESSLGLCDYPTSIHHGKDTTHQACFDPTNQLSTNQDHQNDVNNEEYEPWAVPSTKGAVLLASNPGIWSIENFLNKDELEALFELVKKYGNDLQLFGPCKHDKRSPNNAHPSTGKVCFKISPEHACDGPYDISECSIETHDEDSAFVAHILSRFKDMWSTNTDPLEYAKFQISKGGTAPVDLHMDTFSISFVLYLNDGGAAMVFPNADVTIKPKKGTVHTWLNQHKDGRRNPTSDHAVQAHPQGAGERGVMLLSFEATPEEIMASRTE